MRDLIEFFSRNPIILIFVIGWIFSAVASARQATRQREARRQAGEPEPTVLTPQQQQQQQQSRQRPMLDPRQRPVAGPNSAPRSPEEIADAIRRAMGLEVPRRDVPPVPAPSATTPKPAPSVRRIDYDEEVRAEERSYEDAAPRPVVVYDEAGP